MKNVYIIFKDTYLNETSVVGGEDESKYYGNYFDYVFLDEFYDNNHEQNETQILKTCLGILFKKSNNYHPCIIFGGDLTNQIYISSMVAKEIDSSFVGIYSACSSLILSMILGSVFV